MCVSEELLVRHSGYAGSSAAFSTCFQSIVPHQKNLLFFDSLNQFHSARGEASGGVVGILYLRLDVTEGCLIIAYRLTFLMLSLLCSMSR